MGATARCRSSSTPRLGSFGALVGYLLLSGSLLGFVLVSGGPGRYLGAGADPTIFIWSFGWWPHALLHLENPFFTHAVWSPDGVNLTWVTSVPGLALLFSPITLLAGPVVGYDCAVVACPAVAAWLAFRLGFHLTRSTYAAVFGGLLFGFSPYVLTHLSLGQLNLAGVALVPLVCLLVIRGIEGELRGRALVLRLAPALALQVLISTEIALMLALAVVAGFTLAFLILADRRHQLWRTVQSFLVASLVASILDAPFLAYIVSGFRRSSYFDPDAFPADVLAFFFPGNPIYLGSTVTTAVSRRLPRFDPQPEAYIGLPLLLLVVLFAARFGRSPRGRLLLSGFLLAVICAIGVHLTVGGRVVGPFPWRLVHRVPALDNILPVRFSMLTSLAVALMTTLWVARQLGIPRYAFSAATVITLLPNPSAPAWTTSYAMQPFFTKSMYRPCVDPDERVLPLPIGQGQAMLWQVVGDFRFQIAGGYVGPYIPPSFLATPGSYRVSVGSHLGPGDAAALRRFIAVKGVTLVIVDRNELSFFGDALDRLSTSEESGGVVLYRFRLGGLGAPPRTSCPSA